MITLSPTRRVVILLFIILSFINFSIASPTSTHGLQGARTQISGLYLVKFIGDDADRDSKLLLDYLKGRYSDIHLSISRVINYELLRAASIQIDENTPHLHGEVLDAIAYSNLTRKVSPVHIISRLTQAGGTTEVPKSVPGAERLMAHAMTQVDQVHKEGNTGQGIRIAIIDDGVDYFHEAFGGGFKTPNAKFQAGGDVLRVFKSGEKDSRNAVTFNEDDPMDRCEHYKGSRSGHGTHVAGIIGANSENYTGVAPGATLGMWRTSDCLGFAPTDAIINALHAANNWDPHIISMSIGNHNSWPEDSIAEEAANIAATGTIVVISAGNDGQFGALTVRSPSVGKGVISVASVDNQYTLNSAFQISGTKIAFDYIMGNGHQFTFVPNVQAAGGGRTGACDPNTIPLSIRGRIGVVASAQRCSVDMQIANLIQQGAIGVLIYNADRKNPDLPYTPRVPEAEVPVAGISYNSGEAILRQVRSQKKLPLLLNTGRVVPVRTAGLISEFSSVGPSYENDFKPTITGVGGFMYSTYPRYRGGWTMMNGTSMSAPYVSGALALYMSAKGYQNQPKSSATATYILEQFQNYAQRTFVDVSESAYDSPYRQGAGLLQVYNAIHNDVHVSPGSIALNDTEHFIREHKLTITNYGQDIAAYNIEYVNSATIVPYEWKNKKIYRNEPEVLSSEYDVAQVQISQTAIYVNPMASIEIIVTITPPKTDPNLHLMYGGYVIFQSVGARNNGRNDITVPYIGMVGDQRALPSFNDDYKPRLTDTGNKKNEYSTSTPFIYQRSLQDSPKPLIELTMLLRLRVSKFSRMSTGNFCPDRSKERLWLNSRWLMPGAVPWMAGHTDGNPSTIHHNLIHE
ncbi:peptidase S8/S53 domain-containing protein [Fennellomyces sp. T-0311]|nr:peptidase S8/S53 domain-containing protein [Fennellomyces sp. T-0311]